MNHCIFCKIMAGEIPSARIYEDEIAVIFLDINQSAKGHLLIVPRSHVEQWHELDEEVAGHLAKLAVRWAAATLKAVGAKHYNLFQNNGKAAGQEVMHVHLHLVPRWTGDGYFRLPPRFASREELQATAKAIHTVTSSS